MAKRLISAAAIGAGGLLLLTCAVAYREDGGETEPRPPRNAAYAHEATVTPPRRCALHHARFGGQRAQLIKVLKGGVTNYVVMEVGKRDPVLQNQRSRWLTATYGEGEHIWLGEFSSADAALTGAAQLCPLEARCWPGDFACGRDADQPTPAQIFFSR
jgi:hypothetical protein